MKDRIEIKFQDVDQYLAWRTEWKANYAEIAQGIRDLRHAHKTHQRCFSRAALNGVPVYKLDLKIEVPALLQDKQAELKRYQATRLKFTNDKGWFWPDGERGRLSAMAASAMYNLEEAKQEAQRQWEARHPDLVEISRRQAEANQAAKVERIERQKINREARREEARAKFKKPATAA